MLRSREVAEDVSSRAMSSARLETSLELEQIHRLNCRTFVGDSQHTAPADGCLSTSSPQECVLCREVRPARDRHGRAHSEPPFSIAGACSNPGILSTPGLRPLEVRPWQWRARNATRWCSLGCYGPSTTMRRGRGLHAPIHIRHRRTYGSLSPTWFRTAGTSGGARHGLICSHGIKVAPCRRQYMPRETTMGGARRAIARRNFRILCACCRGR